MLLGVFAAALAVPGNSGPDEWLLLRPWNSWVPGSGDTGEASRTGHGPACPMGKEGPKYAFWGHCSW